MIETHRTTQTMLLAAQWERAKGELRAFATMQGAYPYGDNTERWQELEARVEQFVAGVEEDALHEPA